MEKMKINGLVHASKQLDIHSAEVTVLGYYWEARIGAAIIRSPGWSDGGRLYRSPDLAEKAGRRWFKKHMPEHELSFS
jgi:hypothetical protein